jgi:hypothetical protein
MQHAGQNREQFAAGATIDRGQVTDFDNAFALRQCPGRMTGNRVLDRRIEVVLEKQVLAIRAAKPDRSQDLTACVKQRDQFRHEFRDTRGVDFEKSLRDELLYLSAERMLATDQMPTLRQSFGFARG